MTLEDYKRNLKGVNEGADFSAEFLVCLLVCPLNFEPLIFHILQSNIYESIRKREIVMPEEHTGQLGFEYAWKELLARTRQAGMDPPREFAYRVCLSADNVPSKATF